MSSWSSGSFSPSTDDGNRGARGFEARLDASTNGAGLSTAVGSSYSGATVYNSSPTLALRATITYGAGTPPNIAVDNNQIVPPNSTASLSFDSDAFVNLMLQFIEHPAAGTIQPADALPAAAITAAQSVYVNLVSG